MILDVGRVCRKVQGRDAGAYCVVVNRLDKNFILVEGKKVRSKKVNATHLEPLPVRLNLGKAVKKGDILNALAAKGFA